ncbi:MAG TPA: co-chaperone GroES [Alphaproteobacteria bacterium]|nr:co-chaperone GroES [Alphaproteobacteria bacterium]
MQFKPLHDRVLLKRMDNEEKTTGGIIIPDSAQEKPMEAKVMAVGTGLRAENGRITPLDVKKGDIVLVGKWSGTEIKIDSDELVIVKESDIMGIMG